MDQPLDYYAEDALPASADAVRRLEEKLLAMPQVDLQTANLLHGGMLARTIFIPAGTVLTGALTNCDNICVAFGDITVTTDHGPKRLTGYNVLPAKAGAKRAGIAHSDTWWTTLLVTDATSVTQAEEQMTTEADQLQTRRMCIEHCRSEAIEYEGVPV